MYFVVRKLYMWKKANMDKKKMETNSNIVYKTRYRHTCLLTLMHLRVQLFICPLRESINVYKYYYAITWKNF